MKLAWLTPLVQRSAIGRESIAITDALAGRGHDLTLVGSEWCVPKEPLHATALPRAHWRELSLPGLADEFDLVVANVGDQFDFHGGLFPVLDYVAPLGIFHDFYLVNLFRGWHAERGSDARAISRDVLDTYGSELAELAADGFLDAEPVERLAARCPMTEWVARRCGGALAHAVFYLPRLADSCPGPIGLAGLPVRSRNIAPPSSSGADTLQLLTVGVMNPNKCVDRVIEALGSSMVLRSRASYRLAGPITAAERKRLEDRAQAIGFEGLTVLGSVSEAELNAELTRADVICALRRPVLEGASGSAIEGLLSGRPVIVCDAGFYSDIPDDAVVKIASDAPVAELRSALERLAANGPGRRALGERASQWARETFTVERYLEPLEALMQETVLSRPVQAAARQLGATFAALNLGDDDPAIERIGAQIDELFRPEFEAFQPPASSERRSEGAHPV